MSAEPKAIRELFERRERDFLTSKSRVKVLASVENLDVGDVKVGTLKEGDTVELPRWVAEELAQLRLAELGEEPFETEIFRALSKEKMMGPFQLSNLGQDFYLRMRRRLSYLAVSVKEGRVKAEDYERLRVSSYDLIGLRLSKLLSLSSTSNSLATLGEQLTPEEKVFFTISKDFSREWREALLGRGA